MGKNKNRSAFLPPVRTPNNQAAIMQQLKKQHDAEILQASNNTFNLVASSMLIAAHDMGMDNEDVKELLARGFGILDDVAEGLATIDSMMQLVSSWGIEIYKTAAERTTQSGETIRKKSAVFELLDRGVEEIGQIVALCKSHGMKIDYRDACAIRWEYDRKKYYDSIEKEIDMSKKDDVFARLEKGADKQDLINEFGISSASADRYRYLWRKESGEFMANKKKERAFELISKGANISELMKELDITEAAASRYFEAYREEKCEGEIEVMTEGMKSAFALFDKAYSESQVCELLKLGKATVANYKAEWIRVNKRELSTDEMSDILAGTDAAIVILRHKGVLPAKKEEKKENVKAKKTFVPREGMVQAHEEVKAEEKIVDEQEDIKEVEEIRNEEVKAMTKVNQESNNQEVSILEGPTPKLKKIVKVIEIQGEFTTYKPVGSNRFDVAVDGQIITLSREQMKEFGEELLAVAAEEI